MLQDFLIRCPDEVGRECLYTFDRTVLACAKGLVLTHNLLCTAHRVGARVVFQRSNAIDQVLTLALGLGCAEASIFQTRSAHEVAQQVRDLSSRVFLRRNRACVHTSCDKTDGQALAYLTHERFYPCAVQAVQRFTQHGQIGTVLGTAVQQIRKQCERCILRIQRQDKRCRKRCGLERIGAHTGQSDPFRQFLSAESLVLVFFIHITSFLSISCRQTGDRI